MNKKSNIIIGLSVVAVVVAVVVGMSFMSKPGKGNEPARAAEVAKIAPAATPIASVGTSSASQSGSFVASKNGKKYFPVDCGSAKTIKEENRVYFGSDTEAVQAGYERTTACK